ncbi:MLt-TeN (Mlt-10) related [Aphelenchoides bicaudatus]|nr:MLt-TeN (Mlt-10) related [Aphelenchoides bicaudatus]
MTKLILLLLFSIKCAEVFGEKLERKSYELKTDQLEQVYRRAAIISLLKAKANFELTKLPQTERILYQECQQGAETPVDLAKCLKRLLHQRERNQAQVVIQSQLDEQPFALRSEENWLSSMLKFAMQNPLNETTTTTVQPQTAQHLPTLSQPRDPLRYKRILRIKLNQKFRHAKKLKFQGEDLTPKRVRQPTSPRCKTPKNIDMLRRVEKYFDSANECLRYIKALGLDNSNFISSMFPIIYKNRKPGDESAATQLKSVLDQADSGFSFLSPKILNLLPIKKEASDGKLSFLSPTLLSFHEEGLLPLPRLLRLSGSNACETQKWIDLIMTMTGASRKLNQMLNQFESQMKTLQNDVLPKIKKFQEQERLIRKINETFSTDQRSSMRKFGYAQMNGEQLDLVYSEKGLHPPTAYFSKYRTDSNQDYFLEQMIHELSDLESSANATDVFEKHQRQKRQADKDKPKKTPGLLAPFAFANNVGMPSFLGNLILSPHAFVNDLMNPRFLGSDILSPRAFIASTLSPFSMVARVLAPAAFRTQILSPEALNAYILAHVLSPHALTVAVLSPSALTTKVLSPGYLGVAVLSPSILAANAASKGALNVEVLSPSILVADDGIGK